MFEKLFKLTERKTGVKTEVLAGLTTFMTMAYIIFVNAQILSAAGMDKGAVMVATCVSSAAACFIMGFLANLPIALAPGMGMNALVAFGICGAMKVPWQAAMGMVFISGVLFLLLSLVKFREALIDAIPSSIKLGAAAGIGFFIAFIGLQSAGIVVAHPATLVSLGPLTAKPVLAAVAGLSLTCILYALKVRGSVLLGVIGTGVLCLAMGLLDWKSDVSLSLAPTAFKLDILGALKLSYIPAILTLLFFDTFDTVGTLVGVCEEAKLTTPEGKVPNASRALFSDAAGTVVGSLMGTSTVTSYIESAAGVATGGRTGLTAVVTGVLFLVSLVLLPVAAVLGNEVVLELAGGGKLALHPVTAPALILVGFLMAGALKKIKWDDVTESLPAFLTVIFMPLTFSISGGLAVGFVSYTLLKLVTKRGREVHPIVYTVAAVIVVGYIVLKIL